MQPFPWPLSNDVRLFSSGNSLVIAAIVLSRKLRTCTNALLVSLALADLPVGLVVFPLIALTQKYGPLLKNGHLICHGNIFVTELFLSSSCLHLLFVSVDRYIGKLPGILQCMPGLGTARRDKFVPRLFPLPRERPWLSLVTCYPDSRW